MHNPTLFSTSLLELLSNGESWCLLWGLLQHSFLLAPLQIKWRKSVNIIAELWRAKRARGAPWVSKSTYPRKFGNHVTVHRPPVRPSASQGNQCLILTLSSQFGSTGRLYCTHILHINVVINWQLSKQGIRWPVSPDSIAGSGVDPSRSNIFWKLSADKLLVFKWSQAQV